MVFCVEIKWNWKEKVKRSEHSIELAKQKRILSGLNAGRYWSCHRIRCNMMTKQEYLPLNYYGLRICEIQWLGSRYLPLCEHAILCTMKNVYLKLHRMSCLPPLMVTSMVRIKTICVLSLFSNGTGSAVFFSHKDATAAASRMLLSSHRISLSLQGSVLRLRPVTMRDRYKVPIQLTTSRYECIRIVMYMEWSDHCNMPSNWTNSSFQLD